MRIGLLLCDTHHERLPVPKRFETLFAHHPEVEWEVYSLLNGNFPDLINTCDAYLISGSPNNPTEQLPWINQLTALIRTLHAQRKKLIGVCFGHQLIACALGGTIKKMPYQAACVANTNMLSQESWMTPALSALNLVVMHQYEVATLPVSAKHIGNSDYCQHSIFSVDEHILCMQAHPEIAGDFGLEIVKNSRNAIHSENHTRDIQSFEKTIHRKEIAKWMVNFLRS